MPRLTRVLGAALVSLATAAVATVATTAAAPPPARASTEAYKLSYASLPNGTSQVIRWNGCQAAITYKVNLAAVPTAQRATVLSETQAVIRTLATSTGFRFSYKGQTTEVPRFGSSPTQSAEVVIAYTTPSKTNYNLYGSVLAMGGNTYSWVSRTVSGRTTYSVAAQRGFVVIDTPQTLSYTRGGFGTGLRRTNLLFHELGHVVGLQHVSDTRQQMYPVLTTRAPYAYASTGDVVGLKRVGRGAGCINTSGLAMRDLS